MQRVEVAIECAINSRKYGALITETFELARSQAKMAVKKGLTPFPVVVKDCFAVAAHPVTCASKMLEKYVSPYTATVVQRLIDKGGCVIGKGNMDEFCMGTSSALGHFGPVKSGLTEDIDADWFIPGGSSGGPAVAVQLGIADVGLGSDTGGSSRNPAAFAGIFGLKPTYGVLSRYGLIPLVNSLDAPSILSRSATSCWTYLEYMLGIDEKDPTSIDLPSSHGLSCLKGLRVGIPKEYHNEFLTDDAWRVWNHAANVMQRQGATILPVTLPHTKYSLLCYQVLSAGDIASNMARYSGIGYGYRSQEESSTFGLFSASRTEALNAIVRHRIMAGNYFLMRENRHEFFDCALRIRRIIASEILEVLKSVDVLLTPSAKGPPIRFSELRKSHYEREDHDDFYTQPANLAGVPAISIPFGKSSNNLPVGVQLIGSLLQDKLVCDVAHLLYTAVQEP